MRGTQGLAYLVIDCSIILVDDFSAPETRRPDLQLVAIPLSQD